MNQMQRTSAPVVAQSRLPLIDGLRGLACVLVVWAHTVDTTGWFYQYALSPGKLGVAIFFFISGYLVIPSVTKSRDIRRFVITRALRLYPMYLLSLATAFLIWNYWNSLLRPADSIPHLGPEKPNMLDFLLNITMAQQLFGATNAMGVYWSLTVEFCLYATLVLGLAIWPRMVARHLQMAILFGFIAVVFGVVRWYTRASFPVAVPLGLFCMFLGAVLRQTPDVRSSVVRLAPLYVAVVVPTCAFAYSFDARSDETVGQYLSAYLLGGLIFALVAIFVHVDTGWMMKFLGDRSYGIYLFHMPVVLVVGLWMPVGYLRFVVVLAIVVAVSSVLYRTVELPSVRLGRRMVHR